MAKNRAAFSNRDRAIWFVVFLIGLAFVLGSRNPAHAACGGSPVIVTDKPDYAPTETVAISGTGFNCGEAFSVLVTAPDGSTRSGDGTGAAGPDTVVTDDNGTFSLSYHLSGTLADWSVYEGQLGIYQVEVRDGSGTVVAEGRFSDGPGSFSSCALTAAGGVKCWGSGTYGLLGNGSFEHSAIPVDVIGLTSGVVQITVGNIHACALTTAGSVKCWGANFAGQLGNGTTTYPGIASPVDVIGMSSRVAQISAGGVHTCAVMTGGGAKCWGDNAFAQFGNGTFTGSATPVDVSGLTSGVAQISAGFWHTCALTTVGGIKCWGRNEVGQSGNGRFTSYWTPPRAVTTPEDVTTLTSGVAHIASGSNHTCALTTAGAVMCWGSNGAGELGNGTFTTTYPGGISTPVAVQGLTSGAAQVAAGAFHTCAVAIDGGAKCWGTNRVGELGTGTFSFGSAVPVPVYGLTSGVAQVSLADEHTCALTTGGGVKCWGLNYHGELGSGMFSTTAPPYSIATPVDVFELNSGVAALWDGEPISPARSWTFSGFYHPVEMAGVVNTVKGGSTVPIKFQVFAGATELTDPAIVLQPLTATQTACSGGTTDTVELTATGGTSLRYGGGHFIFNWKTPKMPGYCYTITVALTNGASLSANFELR